VIQLLTAPLDDGAPLTGEVPLPDGRTLYASTSGIVSGDGQTIGRVAVLRDITYLKELDEMKSEFVATVSHDLRTPLTFMRGYATMIPMVGEVSPKQKRYVDKIMIGIEQMTELIDDLLDLGRIEAGVGLIREPCRLDEIIIALVDSMRSQATARGLDLRMGRTEDVTVVVGDAALLRRVISNLVDNAIKYTPKGGTVTVGWETRGDRVLIAVADTGFGIAKADQVRLFEKFSRIKRRETVNIKGSGLGLAIVKSIVERHNGQVRVESELDQGSTFYVELPVDALGES
jgi:signal transduction histidine kinase